MVGPQKVVGEDLKQFTALEGKSYADVKPPDLESLRRASSKEILFRVDRNLAGSKGMSPGGDQREDPVVTDHDSDAEGAEGGDGGEGKEKKPAVIKRKNSIPLPISPLKAQHADTSFAGYDPPWRTTDLIFGHTENIPKQNLEDDSCQDWFRKTAGMHTVQRWCENYHKHP